MPDYIILIKYLKLRILCNIFINLWTWVRACVGVCLGVGEVWRYLFTQYLFLVIFTAVESFQCLSCKWARMCVELCDLKYAFHFENMCKTPPLSLSLSISISLSLIDNGIVSLSHPTVHVITMNHHSAEPRDRSTEHVSHQEKRTLGASVYVGGMGRCHILKWSSFRSL